MDFLEYKRLQRLKASPTGSVIGVTKVVYPDAESQVEVGSLKINCIHSEEGCTWRDQLKSLQAHLNVCKWDAVLCPSDCESRIPRVCMEDHLAFTCPNRVVTCDFCHRDFTGAQMEDHVGNCNYQLVHCENKCGALLQRRFISQHALHECHKRTTRCGHCGRDFVLDTLQNHFQHCPRYPVSCPNRCESPGRIPRDELDRHVLQSCPAVVVECPFKHAGCGVRGPRRSVQRHVDADSKAHLKIMCGLATKQRSEIEELRSRMEAMTRSSDGTLLWRISDFSRLLENARLSPNTNAEICSVPFYTHKYGYKIVASIFPNGDGDGAEGKFLSLYIKILPGDYDNLLHWPFTHPVKFTLMDQIKGGASSSAQKLHHIDERFDPDPDWKTFQRPSKEANAQDCLGYGYPKYVSHEVLLRKHNYVVDDTIFIKIEVDLTYSAIL